MVGTNLCGGEEQTRRKADAFQGVATLASVPIRPIRRTFELTSPCCVKALDRGHTPLVGLFRALLVISNAISILFVSSHPRAVPDRDLS